MAKPVFVDVAEKFFEACETGKGAGGVADYVAADSTFKAQVVGGLFNGIETVPQYADWMKGLLTFVPDGSYDLVSTTWNEETRQVVFFARFKGTHTGEGGPCPPTGKSTLSDYVYYVQLNADNKITTLEKIWNNAVAGSQFGW